MTVRELILALSEYNEDEDVFFEFELVGSVEPRFYSDGERYVCMRREASQASKRVSS